MSAFLIFIFCLGLAPALSHAQTTFTPKANDTIVFLGDSITHQCLYTQYIEDFFYTRYPDLKLHFYNAGVKGDKAGDAIARFAQDVAPAKPNYISVLLGMNDGGYEGMNQERFDTYKKDMQTLLTQCQSLTPKLILLSPSMFDYVTHARRVDDEHFRFHGRVRSPDYNAVMAFYGAWEREVAAQHKWPYVNLWGPMNDFVFQQRRTNSTFTFTPDAIHPDPAGNAVMAYAFLADLQPDRRNVSFIQLRRVRDKWAAIVRGGSAKDLASTDKSISFTYTARALPWVLPVKPVQTNVVWELPENAAFGLKLTKAGHHLSGEVFRATDLAPGTYELKIEGKTIGRFPHTVLASKIELQNYPETPQSQQAMQVALLNRDRNDFAIRPLRDLWGKVKGLRKKAGDDGQKLQEMMKPLIPQMEKLQALANEYEAKIHAAAQPKPLHYELVKVK